MTRRAACLILLVAPGPAFSQASPETLPDMFQDVRRIVAIGDMPRSMLGKILRKQVRELVLPEL